MKHRIPKTLVFSAMTLLAATSAQAATEQQALKQCAKALTDELAAGQNSPVGYTIGDGSSSSGFRLTRSSTFYLDATNPKTGEVVARADCRVSSNGEIISLKMLHLNAHSATQRSRNDF